MSDQNQQKTAPYNMPLPQTKDQADADAMTQVLLDQFRKAQSDNKGQVDDFTNDLSRLPDHLKLADAQKGNASVMADVFTIASLEDEFDLLNTELIGKKNRCSASEYYDKWLFLHLLFEHSGCATQSEYREKRGQLSNEYMQRFSCQHDITVYDDYNPNNIVAVIPAMYRPMQTIKGSATDSVNAFINFGAIDRPDIQNAVNHRFAQAAIDAQKVHKQELELHQAKTYQAMIKVLEYFNPEHPLVKKHHAAISNTPTIDEKITQAPETPEQKKEAGDEFDLEDFGL